jgi:putative ABC transport system permease protein
LRFGPLEINGSAKFVVGSNPKTITKLFDVKPKAGDFSTLGASDIAVSKKTADDKGWKVGDVLKIKSQNGSYDAKIGAIYGTGQQQGLSDYFVSTAAWPKYFTEQIDNQVYVRLKPGVAPKAGEAQIKSVVHPKTPTAANPGYPNAEIQDRTEYKQAQEAQIDQLVNLIYALLALAVIIALIGIANTLALSIVERTRELGLLRAVGMSRAQLRSTIRWESVIIALLGTALGLVIGLFFGWAIVQALKDQGITQFAPPGLQLLVVVVLAGFAGVAAAYFPARRASKLNVLRAIATE